MADPDAPPMTVQELLQRAHEDAVKGSTLDDLDPYGIINDTRDGSLDGIVYDTLDGERYWVDETALGTQLNDLPGNVIGQIKRGYEPLYLAEHLDGILEITGEPRAVWFLRPLADEVGNFKPDTELFAGAEPDLEDVKIPMRVAREGKTTIMAYLAAHGHDNSTIAEALGVAKSTVRVNLSKFKN